MKRGFFFSCFFLFFSAFLLEGIAPVYAATFFGEVPTGLIELKEFHYPVYIFVPKDYNPALQYPLLILLPDTNEAADDLVKEWLSVAKNKNCIVTVAGLELRQNDVPYQMDSWLLNLRQELGKRYRIGRVYLIGKGERAHYAGYIGIQHPETFSGVGMIDGSWVGPFERLMRFSRRPVKQLPFYVSLRAPAPDYLKDTEKEAYQLTAKGYPVYLQTLEKDEKADPVQFKIAMFEWLEKKAQTWSKVIEQSKKTKKEKIAKWVGEMASSPVNH